MRERRKTLMNKQLSIRLIACLCVCALVFSLLPLYALAMYNLSLIHI